MNFQIVSSVEHSSLLQLPTSPHQIPEALSAAALVKDPVADDGVSPSSEENSDGAIPLARATPLRSRPLPEQETAAEALGVMKMKVCVKCKQEKTVLEFHKNSRSSDGLHSYCKDCNRAQALAHIKAEKARKAQLREARRAASGKA